MHTTTQAKRLFAAGRMTPAIDAMPHVDDRGAYKLGQDHALTGHPSRCGVYDQLTHMHEYMVGYRDGQDTLEYSDSREEIEWIRRGGS